MRSEKLDSDEEISEELDVVAAPKTPEPIEENSTCNIVKAIIFYSACSSSLLLVNKMTIALIPLHSYVSCSQFAFASIAVILFNETGCIEPIEYCDTPKIKAYCLYVLTFILSLYSNFRALEGSNIATIIVFRACTPLAVSVLDYVFLGRAMPSTRSMVSLGIIAIGAFGYVSSDAAFESSGFRAYTWVLVWFSALCFNMTYGKMILKQVKTTTWGSVYYTNVISLLPMFAFGTIVAGEWGKYKKLELGEDSSAAISLLMISCVAGLGIGYAGWKCRSLISPTSFTLVGVVNKLLTITMSLLLTDDSAKPFGLVCLVVAISGAAIYKQAPFRDQQPQALPNAEVEMEQVEEENLIVSRKS